MAVGAVEFVVVGFPGNRLSPDVASALTELVRGGIVRVVDMLFVVRDENGVLSHKELHELDSSDSALLATIAQQMDGLIGVEDVEEIAEAVPPGSMAALLLFEHSWMGRIREATKKSGGQVLMSQRIPGYVVEAVASGEL